MSKPDLVLVHPFPHDARYWTRQLATLSDVARVHAWDLPGFGGSTAPLPASLDAMAQALDDAIRRAGIERFVLGGVSMGGYVSFAWCRKHLHEGRLAGLVLADTRPDADTAELRQGRDANAALVREQGVRPLVEKLLPNMFGPNPPADAVAFARTVMESQRPEGVAAALLAMRDRPDSTELLPSIDVPALVVCGSADVVSPPDVMRAMAQRLPRSRWVELPGAGHLATLEQPEAFEAAVRAFLAG